MITLNGTVRNVLITPKGTTDDGKEYGGQHQVQLECEETLRNGEKRLSLVNLRTDDPEPFRKLTGRSVAVPVGAFARGGVIQFYLSKGSRAVPHASGGQ